MDTDHFGTLHIVSITCTSSDIEGSPSPNHCSKYFIDSCLSEPEHLNTKMIINDSTVGTNNGMKVVHVY